jgi:hypothetical protein
MPRTIASGEIWFKGQRALRTALTTLLTLLPLVPQVIAIIQDEWSAGWLTAIGVQAVAINTALTRLIAIPTVDRWLKRIGFGSAPRSTPTAESASTDG